MAGNRRVVNEVLPFSAASRPKTVLTLVNLSALSDGICLQGSFGQAGTGF